MLKRVSVQFSTFQHFNISTFQHFNISTFQHFNISTFSTFSTFQHSTFVLTTQDLNISTFPKFNISTFNMLIQHSTLKSPNTSIDGKDLSENFPHYINNRKSTNLQKVHPPELVYPDSDFS